MPADILKKILRPKRTPKILTVTAREQVTPHMIRLTLQSPELEGVDPDCAGAHCKIMVPAAGQTREAFVAQLEDGPKPITRTYTVRAARPALGEIDIDFADHGDEGPASAFARSAQPGDVMGFNGPAKPKLTEFDADWYLIAADMSALPVAAATLEALPKAAKGLAVFEIAAAEDRQEIDAPPGVEQHWLVHGDPSQASRAQLELIEGYDWPEGRVKTMIAGENAVIRDLRVLVRAERGVDRKDGYASGYWKIGLTEDGHQQVKRGDAEADEARIASMS